MECKYKTSNTAVLGSGEGVVSVSHTGHGGLHGGSVITLALRRAGLGQQSQSPASAVRNWARTAAKHEQSMQVG